MQRFQIGDTVNVRPFDEIDTGDIGLIRRNRDECYAIDREYINKVSTGGPFIIKSAHEDWNTFIYSLSDLSSSERIRYYWAQGMLRFAEECGDNDPIDPGSLEDLFDFLQD